MSSASLRNEVAVKMADKVMDTARQRGEAALRMLDTAAAVSKQGAKGGAAPDPMGISGRQVDLMA